MPAVAAMLLEVVYYGEHWDMGRNELQMRMESQHCWTGEEMPGRLWVVEDSSECPEEVQVVVGGAGREDGMGQRCVQQR
jgi:hypothetical protein